MNKFVTRCLRRLLPLGFAASAAAVLLMPATADATPYVVKLVQQGNNVVSTGSGSIDLTGLTFAGMSYMGPGIIAVAGQISAGAYGGEYLYLGTVTGLTSFGSGASYPASSGSGSLVVFNASGGVLVVPESYVSEGALSGISTFDNASFASLGVTPGTYVWTWGTGADQSFTLDIGSVASVPEPGSLGMFGLGVLLLGAFVERRRRMA